jgi:hypothetical protein
MILSPGIHENMLSREFWTALTLTDFEMVYELTVSDVPWLVCPCDAYFYVFTFGFPTIEMSE